MPAHDKGKSLSVVMPIWNYSLHKKNIQTVLFELSRFKIEVIPVLDSEPLESFSELNGLIKQLKLTGEVVQVSAGNPGDSRNEGKKRATGEWITFWDCDDTPRIETYLKMIRKAEKENSQVVVASYQNENEQRHVIINHEIKIKNTGIHIGLNPGLWRMVFQRDSIEKIDYPSLSMGEDQVFLARVLHTNPRVSLLNEYAYVYKTGNSGQLTSNAIRKREILIAYNTLLKERENSHRHVKTISAMLLRQEITILTQRKIVFHTKIKVGVKFVVRSIFNLDILFLIIRYKISETLEKRTFF